MLLDYESFGDYLIDGDSHGSVDFSPTENPLPVLRESHEVFQAGPVEEEAAVTLMEFQFSPTQKAPGSPSGLRSTDGVFSSPTKPSTLRPTNPATHDQDSPTRSQTSEKEHSALQSLLPSSPAEENVVEIVSTGTICEQASEVIFKSQIETSVQVTWSRDMLESAVSSKNLDSELTQKSVHVSRRSAKPQFDLYYQQDNQSPNQLQVDGDDQNTEENREVIYIDDERANDIGDPLFSNSSFRTARPPNTSEARDVLDIDDTEGEDEDDMPKSSEDTDLFMAEDREVDNEVVDMYTSKRRQISGMEVDTEEESTSSQGEEPRAYQPSQDLITQPAPVSPKRSLSPDIRKVMKSKREGYSALRDAEAALETETAKRREYLRSILKADDFGFL